jgi:hypothetical protein
MMRKHSAKLFMVVLTAIAATALLAPAAQATTPKSGYGQFAGCQSPSESGGATTQCIHSEITGGYFQMGNKNVPITAPMTLVGGVNESFGDFRYNSKGGLSQAKQKVPGGVIGLTGLTWLAEFLGIEALTLYAVTELAGTPNLESAPILEKLPIKVHLINGALGNNCYVGSNSNPINLNLYTGTTSPPPPNTPISGTFPEVTYNAEKDILFFKKGVYVDNSFSAPGASGCVLTLFGFIPISINGLVNSESGLPAPAGTNATSQNQTTEISPVGTVYP